MPVSLFDSSVASFTRWLSPPERVVEDCPSFIYPSPTTGLHFEDIRVLMGVLNKLVDKGNTVIVIEHNLDVIKMADYIIDMGPEGGKGGGELLSYGTPEEVAKSPKGYTPKFLREELGL